MRAALQTGYAWSQMPDGWLETSGSVAEYQVLLKAGSCQVATPVAPSVTEAVCRGGVLLPPILKMSETQGITYTASPSTPPAYVAGQSVTVTATLSAGGTWPARCRPAGRVVGYDGDVRSEFDAGGVHAGGAGLQPVVTQATCADGAVTTPTVVLVVTPGVTYAAQSVGCVQPRGHHGGDGDGDGGRRVRVGSGEPAVDVVSDLRATMTVTLNAASCAEVLPVAPTVVEARCRAGVVERPSLTLGSTD